MIGTEFGSNEESSCPQGGLEAQGPGSVRGAQPERVPVRRPVAKGPWLGSGALATSSQSLGSESESPKDLNFVGVWKKARLTSSAPADSLRRGAAPGARAGAQGEAAERGGPGARPGLEGPFWAGAGVNGAGMRGAGAAARRALQEPRGEARLPARGATLLRGQTRPPGTPARGRSGTACGGLHNHSTRSPGGPREGTASSPCAAEMPTSPPLCAPTLSPGPPLTARSGKGAAWNESASLTKTWWEVMKSGWEVTKGGAFQLEKGEEACPPLVVVIWKSENILCIYTSDELRVFPQQSHMCRLWNWGLFSQLSQSEWECQRAGFTCWGDLGWVWSFHLPEIPFFNVRMTLTP